MNEAERDPVRALRFRDAGHRVGRFATGPHNTITDVSGVLVGHTTLVDEAEGVRSGVTAIVPTAMREARSLAAGMYLGSGHGKSVGVTQMVERAELATPILLTSTPSRVSDHPDRPVVGGTDDAWPAPVVRRPLTREHVSAALTGAHDGPVELGSVGGGAGACALGFKAGIGSASRRVSLGARSATVGALVQADMDGELRLLGRSVTPVGLGLASAGPAAPHSSCVVVLAVDVPCTARQLSRIAARGVFALRRVGATLGRGNGDYGLAFSTASQGSPADLEQAHLETLFTAAMDCVEEAVIDALLAARTITTPTGRKAHALPRHLIRA
ncbi:P1 family peptidase [Embleya sp. NPDC059237]|uniref:P1 family peptidase n=1 Tax=Embleya sp. NPDC059237 TaxID=3346784 RepID=UPI0036764A1E